MLINIKQVKKFYYASKFQYVISFIIIKKIYFKIFRKINKLSIYLKLKIVLLNKIAEQKILA